MAPELALYGIADDPRLDLYALGVIWFEMLTGRALFDALTPVHLVLMHANEPAPPPSTVVPTHNISLEIDAIVARLLAKSPSDRPQSALDVITLIDAIKDRGPHLL